MAEKKETKEIIKPFKTDKSSVWFAQKHWQIIDGELILAAGGIKTEDEYNHVLKYFRTKKMIK